jgi:hypothetical protein
MIKLQRIGALDIVNAIAERIGSYVDMSFIEFLVVEGDLVKCWYMNSGGEGPTFDITLRRESETWMLMLQELPPGTEQKIEVP